MLHKYYSMENIMIVLLQAKFALLKIYFEQTCGRTKLIFVLVGIVANASKFTGSLILITSK
jgi:hypothetical protein